MDSVLESLLTDHLGLGMRVFLAVVSGDHDEAVRLEGVQLGLSRAIALLQQAQEVRGEKVAEMLVPSHN